MEHKLTHIDQAGNAVMVDVGEKQITHRTAIARGEIHMNAEAFAAVQQGTAKKGDVLGVAQIAGIMAAKKTADLIPLCHRLHLTNCKVTFELLPEQRAIEARCLVACDGKTGVEMEALTGCNVALLTIYDMLKALDKRMEITAVHLIEKHGGRSGDFSFEQVKP
ncbi:cyclic pyranopterin monophosphate synthase MoaC [Butyricicoccus sp.]|uniref:cyclic pyranopterin monophosphate synthase MoaC n=1 Tax=Butyricicoccus sp. TaxID=2049021 RepID=UPI003D7EE365